MIKKGDFIEISYTGRLKDDKVVFDTTDEQTAKDSDIYNQNYNYKPVIVCIGENHLVKGLDKKIMGKKPGKYTIEVKAEEGFGKKSADLLKLIPARLFAKDNIKPFVGLEVNVDNQLGIVRSVSGGRVVVDFNHPLASKDLVYDVEIKRIVDNPKEKLDSLLELMQIPHAGTKITDNKAVINTKVPFPEQAVKPMADKIKELTGLKEVSFEAEKPAEKPNNKKKDL